MLEIDLQKNNNKIAFVSEMKLNAILNQNNFSEKNLRNFYMLANRGKKKIIKIEKSVTSLLERLQKINHGEEKNRLLVELKTIEINLGKEKEKLLEITERVAMTHKILMKLNIEKHQLKNKIFNMQKKGLTASLEYIETIRRVDLLDKNMNYLFFV